MQQQNHCSFDPQASQKCFTIRKTELLNCLQRLIIAVLNDLAPAFLVNEPMHYELLRVFNGFELKSFKENIGLIFTPRMSASLKPHRWGPQRPSIWHVCIVQADFFFCFRLIRFESLTFGYYLVAGFLSGRFGFLPFFPLCIVQKYFINTSILLLFSCHSFRVKENVHWKLCVRFWKYGKKRATRTNQAYLFAWISSNVMNTSKLLQELITNTLYSIE